MAMSLNDFLVLYFRQKHFNDMPEAIRAQFDAYAKKDDFRGDMKSWKQDLTHTVNGKIVNNDLPALADTPDNANTWESFFLALQNAFITMSANKGSFKENSAAVNFLEEYFGDAPNKPFSLPPIDPTTKASIDQFINDIIKSPSINSFAMFGSLFNDDYGEYAEFTKALDEGKHLKDPKVRDKLVRIVSSLASRLEYGDITNNDLITKLQSIDLNGIVSGLNKRSSVDPNKLAIFKRKYTNLLNQLHDQPKIYDVFKQYDNGKISKQLDKAIAKTDYTGKITEADYVPPKRTDEKTVWQEIQGKVQDTYSDTLKKYMTAHRDHIYFKDTAKTIMGALDGAKIKPTDGITAVLDKQADISKKLKYKSPTASEHFDWFAKTMTELKDTMPKAFEGALRNGNQMRRLIEELIVTAVEQSKTDSKAVEKAKTAMEVLTVMQYGTFTSRTMDALGKTDVNLFSDKDLSWNKNSGIKMVTGALDKTIKFGLMTTGYAATAVVNKIRRIGINFNNSGDIKKKSDKMASDIATQKTNEENAKTTNNNLDRQTILNNDNILRNISGHVNDTNIDQRRQDLRNGEQSAQQYSNDINTETQRIQPWIDIENDKNKYATLLQQEQDLSDEINGANGQPGLWDQLQAIPNPPQNAQQIYQAQVLQQQIQEKEQKLQETKQELANIDSNYQQQNGVINAYNAISGQLMQGKINLNQLNQNLTNQQNANNTLSGYINQYDNAKEEIRRANEAITKREQEWNKWDENHKNTYNELMAYWDFMQTGNTKNLLRFSTKSLQKKMDGKRRGHQLTRMEETFIDWQRSHGYAA